jgi:hypothetical protein
MYDKLIKKHLKANSVNEESVPGVKTTDATQKDEAKVNKDYYKDVEKKMSDYNAASTKKDKDGIDAPKNKLSKKEEEIMQDIEMGGGMQDLTYHNEPDKRFKERQEMAIKGDSKMGNKIYSGKENGNTESTWGASDDELGEKIIKRTKRRQEKIDAAADNLTSFGDDIEFNPNKKSKKSNIALENTEKNNTTMEEGLLDLFKQKSKYYILSKKETFDGGKRYDFKTKSYDDRSAIHTHIPGELSTLSITVFDDNLCVMSFNRKKNKFENINDALNYADKTYDEAYKKVVNKLKSYDTEDNNITEKNNKLTETSKMKRLRFKSAFNGMENALNLIPEGYKEDNKVFEMTDGNESYKVRWEGNLTEGKVVVLQAANQEVIKEDMNKIFHLMNYKSENTLGTVKGKDRIQENTKFSEIWDKAKTIIKEDKEKKDNI